MRSDRVELYSAKCVSYAVALALFAGAVWPLRLMPATPFMPSAVAVGIVALGLALAVMADQRAARIRWTLTSACLGLLCLTVILQPLIHDTLDYPEELIFPIVTIAVSCLLANCGANLGGAARQAALRIFCVGATLAAIFSLLLQFAQWRLPPADLPWWIMKPPSGFQPFGNYAQRNQLALLFAMAVVCVAYLSLSGRIWWQSFAAPALAGAFLFGIVLSGSRTGLAIGWVAYLVWPYLRAANPPTDGRFRRMVRGLITATALYVAAFMASQWIVTRTTQENKFETALTRLESQNNLTRIALQEQALQTVRDYPIVGSGWGTFAREGMERIHASKLPLFADNSHFYVTQLWSELGIAGLSLAVAFTSIVITLVRGARTPMQKLSAGVAVIVWIASVTEYPLWLAFFFLPVAFVVSAGARGNGNTSTSQPRSCFGHAVLIVMFSFSVVCGAIWSGYKYREVNAIGNRIFGVQNVAPEVRAAIDKRKLAFGFDSIYDMYTYVILPMNTDRLQHKIELGKRVLSKYVNTEFMTRQAVLLLLAGEYDESVRLMQASCLLHPSRCNDEIETMRHVGDAGLPAAVTLVTQLQSWWTSVKRTDPWLQQRMMR